MTEQQTRYYQIRQMHNRPATMGVQLSVAPGVRKLLPGEIFALPCASLPAGENAAVADVVAKLGHLIEPVFDVEDESQLRPISYGSAHAAALADPKHDHDDGTLSSIDKSLAVSQQARQEAAIAATTAGKSAEQVAAERQQEVIAEAPPHLQDAFEQSDVNAHLPTSAPFPE